MCPFIPGESYEYTQPLYDTMQLAAAAGPQTYNFFSTPLGGALVAGVPKGYQHTNMIQAGVLEKGHRFVIEGISMYVRETAQAGTFVTLADYRVLMGGHVLLQITQREFLRVPSAKIPAGGAELIYFSNIAPAVTEFKLNHGISANQNVFWLKKTIPLEDQQAFNVVLTIPGTIAAVTDVTIMLEGTLFRPVL
jgi:hypothetical protein